VVIYYCTVHIIKLTFLSMKKYLALASTMLAAGVASADTAGTWVFDAANPGSSVLALFAELSPAVNVAIGAFVATIGLNLFFGIGNGVLSKAGSMFGRVGRLGSGR